MRPLGLYVHIPFCLRKCAYCSFVSFAGGEADFDRYLAALAAEARIYAPLLADHVVDTVFLGGGTPSLLEAAQMETLTRGLSGAFDWQVSEFTIEANPETVSADKLEAYADCGVNRLSIGLQTHDDAILARIGRLHSWETFAKGYAAAARRFGNISVDTIFGLPGQSVASHLETVRRVIALAPQHVSAYALKLEAGTPLAQSFAGADEDDDRAMCHGGTALLEAAGYAHYETSSYAGPGRECRHNMKYWTGGEYLGLGVAAHSYLEHGGARRFGNVEDIETYIGMVMSGRRPVACETALDMRDRLTEYLMLRLRLKRGIDFSDYRALFGGDFARAFGGAIGRVQKAGLILTDEKGIRPTEKGFDLQNALIGEFIKNL